jgi:hypothetical protein
MPMKENKITNKQLVLESLAYISNRTYNRWNNNGFIDIRVFWYKRGIPIQLWKSTQQTLFLYKNELVRLGYGQPFSLEITATGNDALNDPKKFNDLNFSHLEQFIILRRRNWIKRIGFFFYILWLQKIISNPWAIAIIAGLIVALIGGWCVLIFGTEYLVKHHILH